LRDRGIPGLSIRVFPLEDIQRTRWNSNRLTVAATILIVDDAGALRGALRRVLETAGFQVADAEDVDAALRCLAEGPIDIVLTDVQMPGRSGVELARIVTREFPSTKIVVMSTLEDVTRLQGELSISAALTKPMKPDLLVGTVLSTHGA
jgi:two-component system response regulator FlrC